MLFRLMSLMLLLSAFGWAQQPTVRLPEDEGKKLIVTRVDPDYPPMAKQMHLAGKVVVDVYIDEDGKVEKVETVNGNPLLSGAAVAAVKKWKFTPFSANGQTRRAVTAVGFNFKL